VDHVNAFGEIVRDGTPPHRRAATTRRRLAGVGVLALVVGGAFGCPARSSATARATAGCARSRGTLLCPGSSPLPGPITRGRGRQTCGRRDEQDDRKGRLASVNGVLDR